MNTRYQQVRDILQRLHGEEPDAGRVAQMANIAEAVEIAPTDALFPLMVALEYYRVTYQEIPAGIRDASAFVLREHADAFRAEASAIEAQQKARLAEGAKTLIEAHRTWMQKIMPGVLHEQLRDTAGKALAAPLHTVVEKMTHATQTAEDALHNLRELRNEHTWARFGATMTAAVAAGTIASLVAAWMLQENPAPALTADQRTLLRWGMAVETAWPRLSADAQGMLKAAAATTTGQEAHANVNLKPVRQLKRSRLPARQKEQPEQDQTGKADPSQSGGAQ